VRGEGFSVTFSRFVRFRAVKRNLEFAFDDFSAPGANFVGRFSPLESCFSVLSNGVTFENVSAFPTELRF